MTKFIRSLAFAGVLFFLSSAQAGVTPLSVGIMPPVQFPPSDFTITGLRASILYGHHRDVYGIDVGALGNITDQNFVGIGLSGLFNMTQGQTTILLLQAAGVANINTQKTNVYGIQATLGVNSNTAASSVTGLQLGAIANLSDHTNIYGAQVGLYNSAQDVYGLQIGLVNMANSLHGVQIGLINFNHTGTFSVSPILNVGF